MNSTAAVDIRSTNLFLVLGKYVQRQHENLLTQALVLLFNRVAPFRKALCDQLSARSGQSKQSTESLVAHSQVRHRVGRGSILVDMEIFRSESNAPVYLIESKLDAGLGPEQIRRYSAALSKLSNTTRFVVLTRGGADDALRKIAPAKTIWLSWPYVAEIVALSAKRASLVDKFLIKDFLDMVKLKGIKTIPAMTADRFNRLKKISDLAFNRSNGLLARDWSAVSQALLRLEEHRDSTWESMFPSANKWKPYQGMYRSDNYIVLYAGFYQWKPSKKIRERFICLELHCDSNSYLEISHGWRLGPNHPRYQRSHQLEHDERSITTPNTRKLFMMNMPRALEYAEPTLRHRANVFLRSKYMRAE